eukprot:scaffold1147_cov172-Amphora_coffeaeformis.AAC.5
MSGRTRQKTTQQSDQKDKAKDEDEQRNDETNPSRHHVIAFACVDLKEGRATSRLGIATDQTAMVFAGIVRSMVTLTRDRINRIA